MLPADKIKSVGCGLPSFWQLNISFAKYVGLTIELLAQPTHSLLYFYPQPLIEKS